MAMADSRWQRTVTLCALYVAQGVPWGFMTVALISYLTSRGINDAQAGKLTAIVLVPWTFKLIWAPLIDSVTIRSMGRRRAWIIGAELLMALTLLGILALGDLTENLRLLGWMFFLHNCFASLQDVCTDAMAVDILPAAEQGSANGLMWGSKLVGKGVGAWVMAVVMRRWGLPTAVLLQFGILMVIMLFPLLFLERRGEKRLPWSAGQAVATAAESETGVRSPLEVLRDLLQGFSLRTTLVFAVFAVAQIVGYGLNEIVTKTLYTQQLGWDFVEFSRVAGLYVIVPTLLVCVTGGYLSNRYGRRPVIIAGMVGYAACALAFAACPGLWDRDWFTTAYLLATDGFIAVGSVGFLSMAMRITWTKSSATMFTVYMTLSNVGHFVGNWLAGPVREWLPYEPTFLLVGIASLLPLVCLPLVSPEQVDAHKYPDPTPAPAEHVPDHSAVLEPEQVG
jgi:MFS transporter, PAT family, beta-lactamase induction signal transducer AmpG